MSSVAVTDKKTLWNPMCRCETIVETRIRWQEILLIRVEYRAQRYDTISNCKVTIEDSFTIKNKSDQEMYLLGFTVHNGNHYISYMFSESEEDVAFVKFDDTHFVELIPNPGYEIYTLDANSKLRPTTFIYGQATSKQQEYLQEIDRKIKETKVNYSKASKSSAKRPRRGNENIMLFLTQLLKLIAFILYFTC